MYTTVKQCSKVTVCFMWVCGLHGKAKKIVTAYFPRKKLMFFGLAGQRCSIDSRPGDAWCRIPSGSGLARWK